MNSEVTSGPSQTIAVQDSRNIPQDAFFWPRNLLNDKDRLPALTHNHT